MTTGKRAEILLDRQVALLIDDNRVVSTIAVSTGKPSTPTPPGHYHVYAKIERWWSTPFRDGSRGRFPSSAGSPSTSSDRSGLRGLARLRPAGPRGGADDL
jgi:hypothetical protein